MFTTDDQYVDGNAALLEFADVFGTDLSAAVTTCGTCASATVFAELRVYNRGPGLTIRCPHCESVVARLTRTQEHAYIDLSGSSSMRLQMIATTSA